MKGAVGMTKVKNEEVVFRQKNYLKAAELLELRTTVRSLQGEQLELKQKLRIAYEDNQTLKDEIERLQQMVHIDSLTQLKNREGFEVFFENQVALLKSEDDLRKETSKSLGLLVIDVDYFKRVNDVYGHQIGDDVLVAIAEVLTKSVREHIDVVCRWGGEEFAIILPNINESDLPKVAEKIRSAIADLNFDQIPNLQTSVSIGGAIQSHQSEASLFARADLAVLQAKADGRNRIVFAEATNS